MCLIIVSELYVELWFGTTVFLLRVRVSGLTFTYFIYHKLCSLLLTGGVTMKLHVNTKAMIILRTCVVFYGAGFQVNPRRSNSRKSASHESKSSVGLVISFLQRVSPETPTTRKLRLHGASQVSCCGVIFCGFCSLQKIKRVF